MRIRSMHCHLHVHMYMYLLLVYIQCTCNDALSCSHMCTHTLSHTYICVHTGLSFGGSDCSDATAGGGGSDFCYRTNEAGHVSGRYSCTCTTHRKNIVVTCIHVHVAEKLAGN